MPTESVLFSGSVSFAKTPPAASTVSGVLTGVTYVSLTPVGASFAGATLIVTVAFSTESRSPSFTLYVKEVAPLKLDAGVKRNDPFAFKTTVPCATGGAVTRMAVSGLFSGSVSSASTPGAAMESGTSSVAAYVSSFATGRPLMLMLTVVFAEFSVPSVAR